MPNTRNPALAFFFLLFIIWLIFPDGEFQGQPLTLPDLATERLSKFHHALDELNQTHWGDFVPFPKDGNDAGDAGDAGAAKYVNLTGFRQQDGFAWEDLARFKERGLQISRHAISPVQGQQLWDIGEGEPLWANASGTLHGEWVRRPGSVARTYDSYNLSRSVPDMDWANVDFDWARNITGASGRMLLRLDGNKTVTEYEQLPEAEAPLSGGVIRNVRAAATFEDTTGSGKTWEMRFWGLHWPRQGVIMLTTTSEKFEGIFGLPHLAPSRDFYQSGQLLLNQTLARVLRRKEKTIYVDQNIPWGSDVENPLYTAFPSPRCEFVMYAQVHPPSIPAAAGHSPGKVADAIHAIESELENPMGAPIRAIPNLQMSAVVYSPDCGFFLETKGPPEFPPGEAQHLVGAKSEVHVHQIKTWLLMYAVVVFAQVHLLKNQVRESSTPSTMGRVSFGTIAVMVIVDGMTFTAAATWVSSAAATFLPTLALMFVAFLSMTIGGSFLGRIHEIQLPESRGRRERDQASGNGSDNTTPAPSTSPVSQGDAANEPLLPGPVTSGRPGRPPSPPIIIPSDGDIDAEIADSASAMPGLAGRRPRAPTTTAPSPPPPTQAQTFQSIIGRFVLISLCISFIAITSSTWYPGPRSFFLNSLTFVYLSLWVPQIHRNAIRNCRRALTWEFVVGQSVLRLLPVAYFWVKSDNFLYARPERGVFAILCAWVWLQIFILGCQDVIGPRFGIPASWTPDAWDYHPVLREDNVETGGLPIGLAAEDNLGLELAEGGEQRDRKTGGLSTIDCTICREVLEVPVVRAGEEDMSVAGVFARRIYMVTPCRHIFHTACLEGWMRFRLQCPICREELPPL